MSTTINSSVPTPNAAKNIVFSESLPAAGKLSPVSSIRQSADSLSNQKDSTKVPVCLIKLVRSIVRTFYLREHSLIVDMLVRNTIMKEDDLCERLRFERKQLRQYLHTLKCDQFIKSKLQLETDADGKTTKITHYFIDYKLFVNVVKYRLDQMQRRLEAEQRQSTSRASFKCSSCNTTYTDLEVDRLMDFTNPGKLVCVYCRREVCEEENNASRTDARALIAKFHHQVRDPIDLMLRECDEIHLSPAILEPEIRPLEPLNDDFTDVLQASQSVGTSSIDFGDKTKRNSSLFGPTENSVRIVLKGNSSGTNHVIKERPIWMSDSTISLNPTTGIGDTDSQANAFLNTSDFHPNNASEDIITQTLVPGRVPSGSGSNLSNSVTLGSSHSRLTDTSTTSTNSSTNATGGVSTASSDIMQLLLVHERRGLPNQNSKNTNVAGRNNLHKTSSGPPDSLTPAEGKSADPSTKFEISYGGQRIPYKDVTSAMVKTMTKEERADYIMTSADFIGILLSYKKLNTPKINVLITKYIVCDQLSITQQIII
ncbi:General transcription factor IIE subunit 1 [Schistosoma japonicum]|nr:General transcription factor IIE subunit 1 [Schistosoma japonicum]KAH8864303.1 General transcription factor IIE subunit 1 [Schistosoma japonicum]